MAAIPVNRKAIMSDGVAASFPSRKIGESGYTIGDPVKGVFRHTACVSLRCPGFDYAPREPQKRILLGSEG